MPFPVIQPCDATPADFVAFWDRFYTGYDERFYEANIGQPLNQERIAKWFEWKNGTPLAAAKAQSILRYALPNERISEDADAAVLRDFLNREGGSIWRIFWLHLQHPGHFPIYDQHVHRAMAWLRGWRTIEIPKYGPAMVQMYLEEYRPFFRQFAALPARKVDRALWTFGKFLSSGYAEMLSLSAS